MRKKNEKKRYFSIPIVLLLLVSFCLFIRSFYSFSWSDESFYLTMAHRFWLGERMFADEWYTTQLSTPLLLPFYAFYQWLTGGNEGVYLYFRLLYWGISTATAVYTYYKLKKWNPPAACLICSLLYLLYSRANIGGISYYNMTLTCILLAALLIYGQLCEKKARNYQLCLTGLFLAAAVVNTPFLAVPYILVVLWLFIRKKYRLIRKNILTVVISTAVAAIVYLSYVLSHVSMEEILLNIPYIMNEPELQNTNPVLAIPLMCARIVWRYKWTIWAMGALFLFVGIRKKRGKLFSRKELSGILAVDFLVFLVNYYLSGNMIGCINIAGTLFATPLLYVYSARRSYDKRVLFTFVFSGLLVAAGFSFSSDTGLDAMTIGFVLIVMGIILLLFQEREMKENRMLRRTVMSVCVLMLLQSAFLRFFSVYRDAPLGELDTQIVSGPAQYLYTTEEHARQYENLKAAIEKYVREEDVVFYSKWCFWSYLCSDNEYGVPSSWRMPIDSPRLEEYFELNPEKIPTCIFVLNPAYGDFESSWIQSNEKVERPNENDKQGFLMDYILKNNYEEIRLECATIYRDRR